MCPFQFHFGSIQQINSPSFHANDFLLRFTPTLVRLTAVTVATPSSTKHRFNITYSILVRLITSRHDVASLFQLTRRFQFHPGSTKQINFSSSATCPWKLVSI